MNLSIIIVSYNTKELLENCLNSLYLHCKKELENNEYEIIVVDNASNDGSVEFLRRDKPPGLSGSTGRSTPTIKIIENNKNLGFSAANNIGIKAASGDLILLLNSDTEVKEGSVQGMVKFMGESRGKDMGGDMGSDSNIGASTCRILLSSGKIDPACHRGFPTPWNAFCYFSRLEKIFPKFKIFSGYHQTYKNLNTVHQVDAISGAFFMTSKTVIEKVGLLDEDYFMYGEDIDWCYRMKQVGFSIWYNPNFEIVHHKKKSGRDSGSTAVKTTTQHHFWQTMRIFYEKHYAGKYPKIVNYIILKIIYLKTK